LLPGEGKDRALKRTDSIKRAEEYEALRAAQEEKKAGKNIVDISTLRSKMLFDKEEITLPARSSVVIRFTNPDEMPHNFVIIQKGSLEKVGKAADAMAAKKDGFDRNFIPSVPEVLFATPLVAPGESFDLEFYSPKAGEYTFICSFPGHWTMMKGVIKFVENK
jgi:azurin